MSSDDTTDGDDDRKDKRSDYDRANARGDVSPADERIAKFLSSLFVDEKNYPESVEVRQVKGRDSDRMGELLKKYTFSSAAKPGAERLTGIANEMSERMRIYTDVRQRDTVFHIAARNPQLSDELYDRILLRKRPNKGSGWKNRGEEFDIEGDTGDDDVPFALSYQKAFLSHAVQQFGLIGGTIEGLLDRSDRQAKFMGDQLERVQCKYIELLEVNLKLVQADDERKARLRRAEIWDNNLEQGFKHAWALIPPMLTAAVKKDHSGWQPGTDSTEAYTLREFFELRKDGDDSSGKLTVSQLTVIFGDVDESGKIIKPGILTEDQGMLLAAIAKMQVSPDHLDDLIEGGQHEITKNQVMKILAAGIPGTVLGPLKMLFDVRMAKRAERQQQQKTNGKGE